MNTSIQSKDVLIQTIRILASHHREVYINESVIDGNREMANNARRALDTYKNILLKIDSGNASY